MAAFHEGADEMENIASQELANAMLKGAYDGIRYLDEDLYEELPNLKDVPLERAAEFVANFGNKIIQNQAKDGYVLSSDTDIDALAVEIDDFFNPKDEQDDETE